MNIKCGLLLCFTNFLIKSLPAVVVNLYTNKSAFNNEKLAVELHKPIIKKI